MADSPLITSELRDYIQKFKIEETVTRSINTLAHKMPSDPFTFLAGFFSELSEEPPCVTDIHSREILLDSRPSLEVTITCQTKGQVFPGPSFVFSPGIDEINYTLDSDRLEGKGMRSSAVMAQGLKSILIDQDIANQRKIDSILMKEPGLGSNVTVSVSFACLVAAAFFKRVPLYHHVFEKYTRREWDSAPFPKLMLPILFTGKSNGSKIKFSRWILYEASHQKHEAYAVMEAIKKIYETVRKILASGKGGESGLRPHLSGFIPAFETNAECFKIIEDAVNQTGFALGEDFLLAIDCNSEEYYLKDSQKYEMEGFKVPPDLNQITEFYIKLLNDKPYIGILFDPFVLEDLNPWKNLSTRVPAKRLGSIKLSKDPEKFKNLLENEETKTETWVPQVVSSHYSYPVTTIIDMVKIAAKHGCNVIISEHPYESLDTSIVDLALGLKCEFLQISAPIKFQHLSKFNRIIQLRS
jgi:enolase